jgi:NDP-sugar pyrophosphorylase family protein|tara:strand:+ start:12147 stop:12821 length:675 start_codon:yes stop_codon:yes gene_type:complete
MQVVILAGGRGKRMQSLTQNIQKAMLTVSGKNLIEYKLGILPPEVDKIVITIGYLGEQITGHFGDEWNGKKIHYVEQGNLEGTGHALFKAKHLLQDRFVVMMGDDIYSREDLSECLKHPWAMLVKKSDYPGDGGKVVLDKHGHLLNIVEGSWDKNFYINTGLYVLGKEFFNYSLVQIQSGEFGLPQTLVEAAKDFDVKVVEAEWWTKITSPEDIKRVEEMLSAR